MISDMLKNRIQIVDKVIDWKDAIKIASQPLLNDGSINIEYIDAMIENVNKFGSYIVVAPKVAMPHSKGEHGVNKNCLALLQIKQGVFLLNG